MRAPTTMPGAEGRGRQFDRAQQRQPGARPVPLTKPSGHAAAQLPTERRSSTGSVSARRMLATASPEGNVSRMRSTSTGVYSMPTPTPNMPMHSRYSTSCQAGGCGSPIQTIAWISTPMPLMLGHRGGGGLDVVGAVLAVARHSQR